MPDTGKKKKKKPHRFYDYSLLFTIIFLTVFGLVMIYSASSYKAQLDYDNPAYFAIRQAAIAGGSFVVMYIVSKIDYHWFARFAVLGYALSWITMLLTMFSPLGVASHGKKRWLKVGPGMLQFQPTELVKISLILFVAVFIAELGTRINKLRPTLVIIGFSLPLALLVTANNLSSGIIICGIVFVMLFVACKIKWPFFACAGAGVGLLAAAPYIGHILVNMHILKDYQLGRINVWKNPIMYSRSGGYQVLQGLYAIGSGGLFGKGLGESLQKLGPGAKVTVTDANGETKQVSIPRPVEPEEPVIPGESSSSSDGGSSAPSAPASPLPGLTVTDKSGAVISYTSTQSGNTLTICVGRFTASLRASLSALRPLRAEGIETITFQTILCSTTLSVDELLAMGGEDAEAVLTHRLTDSSLTVG